MGNFGNSSKFSPGIIFLRNPSIEFPVALCMNIMLKYEFVNLFLICLMQI